ncbi:hypothetical protein AVEN_154077-1 [Araneus ventricosus]|uniref:Uncharacterized protein n=1 Tax=Araneus ventricosus TaxID=182803 RepID=A0A4Y2GTX1_ARAVE|nr:hypothetical protein AVEN_154077-1 [Araneus ventricosus]
MSLQKQLSDVQYFVHMIRDEGYVKTYIFSLGFKAPLCLERHIIKTFAGIGKCCDDTDVTPFPQPYWQIKLRVFFPVVSSQAELQNILKTYWGIFGVWGQEQLEYFSRFLDNVWDVSSDIVKQVLHDTKYDPKINIPYYLSVNLGQLFVAILKKHEGEDLKDWIENIAWKSFLMGGDFKDEENLFE